MYDNKWLIKVWAIIMGSLVAIAALGVMCIQMTNYHVTNAIENGADPLEAGGAFGTATQQEELK